MDQTHGTALEWILLSAGNQKRITSKGDSHDDKAFLFDIVSQRARLMRKLKGRLVLGMLEGLEGLAEKRYHSHS